MHSFLKPRSTVIGKAFSVFLCVVVVSCLVFAVALFSKRDLDKLYLQLIETSEQELTLEPRLFVLNDLRFSLLKPHSGGGPDDATVIAWEANFRKLDALNANHEWPKVLPIQHATLTQHALVDLQELLKRGTLPERVDGFIARTIPAVDALAADMEIALRQLHNTRKQLDQQYEQQANVQALWMVVVGSVGFLGVCLFTGWFFMGLSRDLRRLKARTDEIGRGEFGEPLALGRRDEVGQLAEGVNAMAVALDERAREIESARNRRFQDEKMFALGTVAAGITHEISNPINAIMMVAERVRSGLEDDSNEAGVEANLKRVDLILEQIERITHIVRELGEFSSPVSGKLKPISVNPALMSAIHLLRYDPRFRKIELITNLSPEIPMVNGVSNHITQVAINTLINAVDAIDHDDGRIVVTSKPEGNGVLVIVEDNGHGMSEEVMEKARRAFFTTKASGKGTGLGLAVCRAIVDDHQGTLKISSESGVWTKICIRIPGTLKEEGE